MSGKDGRGGQGGGGMRSQRKAGCFSGVANSDNEWPGRENAKLRMTCILISMKKHQNKPSSQS